MTHWGNVLKEARIRAGLTQEELAAKVGISVSYIRKMETGLLGPPRRNKAKMLADALSITDEEERNAFFRAAEVGNDEDMQGFRLVKIEDGQQLRRRRDLALASPPIEESSPGSDSIEARTVGQDIDEVFQDLSQEERNRLREILVPHATQLARLMKLKMGG